MNNRQTLSTFLGIAAAVVLAANANAAIINVPGDQPTIQAGINAAVDGDEVVVATGTYFENISFLGKAITVRSTDPNDAGVVANTIIDGGLSGTVVTCDSGEGSNTVLSGFLITGGSGTGGGMVNSSSSPTVTNCTFVGNSGNGGGMFNSVSSPTVINCTFTDNFANTGGGMSNFAGSSPTLTNCSFIGNTAPGGGAGIMNQANSGATLTNCFFGGNSAVGGASGGGAILSHETGMAVITDSLFCANTPNHVSGPYTDNGGNEFAADCNDFNDCNGNGIFDVIEVAKGLATDFNGNGIPDDCECLADITGNGEVNVHDLVRLLLCFGLPALPECEAEDINFDGTVNVLDLIQLLLQFGQACP